MTDPELRGALEKLVISFEEVRQEVRRREPNLYETWKAGGFLVCDDVHSMYPDVATVVGRILEDDAREKEEEEEP